jgi:hypothetical protein
MPPSFAQAGLSPATPGENMSIGKLMTALLLGAAAMLASVGAIAQEKYPLVLGDYWEVTGVKIKDGGGLTYAEFVAGEWKQDGEFA